MTESKIGSNSDGKTPGTIYWLTGLSAAGKTTLATNLARSFREDGRSVVILDGDVMRGVLGEVSNFSRDERLQLAYKYSRMAKMLADQGIDVIVAAIALFREIHRWNRQNMGSYLEIFLDVPLEELRRRDPKGIYRRFDLGEIKDVAGLDFEVEFPENPDLVLSFDPSRTVEDCTQEVTKFVRGKKGRK